MDCDHAVAIQVEMNLKDSMDWSQFSQFYFLRRTAQLVANVRKKL